MQIGKIEYPTLQKSISPFYESKGIRLDVYTADESHVFDIEIQTSIPPDLGKRTRYYQSMMDSDNLLKGQNYNDLKESYVIFICLLDPFKLGLPVYTFKNLCEENPTAELNDKSYKLFYNASAYEKENDKELFALLQYISAKQTVCQSQNNLCKFAAGKLGADRKQNCICKISSTVRRLPTR